MLEYECVVVPLYCFMLFNVVWNLCVDFRFMYIHSLVLFAGLESGSTRQQPTFFDAAMFSSAGGAAAMLMMDDLDDRRQQHEDDGSGENKKSKRPKNDWNSGSDHPLDLSNYHNPGSARSESSSSPRYPYERKVDSPDYPF